METKNLAWGLHGVIPKDAVCAFGARTILDRGYVDIVSDRRQYEGVESEFDTFSNYLSQFGMPAVRTSAKELLGNDDTIYRFDYDKFHIRWTPNASHGYLYISAWLDA